MEKRIYLRDLEKADLEYLHMLYGNENTAKYMRHGAHQTIKQTEELMNHYFEKNNVAYVVLHCDTDDFVGYVSFVEFEDEPGKFSLSIMSMEKYWNGGYSTEAVLAGIEQIKDNDNIKEVYAYIVESNIGSCRVMEKCGFHLFDKMDIGPDQLLFVYRLILGQ